MRIIQLITRRQRRGAEVFAAELADALMMRGHVAVVAGLYPTSGFPLEPERARSVDVAAPTDLPLDPRTVVRLVGLFRRMRPDLVQANGSDTLKYSVLARAVSRGRWPLVYRNISVASRWLRGDLHRAWNRWLIHRVDGVVPVSRTSAEDLVRTYGLARERLCVIPQSAGIPERVDAAGARRAMAFLAPVPPMAPLLMQVGSLSPEKNHLWFLEVFQRVREGVPDVHLVIAGDGALRARIEARVRELGLEERVHLLGTRDDAADLVAGADLLVLPSLVEGLPAVVLEAGARRVPSVATDVGGVSEAIRDRETGILVPSGDGEAFASAVTALLEDQTRRSAMGDAARALVAAEFELAAAVDRYEALYETLVHGGGSR